MTDQFQQPATSNVDTSDMRGFNGWAEAEAKAKAAPVRRPDSDSSSMQGFEPGSSEFKPSGM